METGATGTTWTSPACALSGGALALRKGPIPLAGGIDEVSRDAVTRP
jgi:hypothetical protein